MELLAAAVLVAARLPATLSGGGAARKGRARGAREGKGRSGLGKGREGKGKGRSGLPLMHMIPLMQVKV